MLGMSTISYDYRSLAAQVVVRRLYLWYLGSRDAPVMGEGPMDHSKSNGESGRRSKNPVTMCEQMCSRPTWKNYARSQIRP
jgi:hypothetical protein